MKRVLPWQVGKKFSSGTDLNEPKKNSRKLAQAVRACFEELELRRMLSVSANPNGPYVVNEGSSIQIGGSATGAAGYSYKWDLNYNGQTFHTQATGQGFTYKAADGPVSHTIALKVININDATDFDLETTTLTINNVAPTITLTGSSSSAAGDVYTLNFGATDPGQDTISGWDIDWGDGSTHTTTAGNATSATHVFGTAGATTVTVTATDEDGSYQQTKNVNVSAVTPDVTVTGNPTVDEGSVYTLNFSSTHANIRNGWTIDWGDGETDFDDTSISADTHTYADNGSYTITVGAITDDTEGDGTLNLTVNNVAPTIAITGAIASSPEGTPITVGSTESDPGVNDTETYAWSVTKDGNAYSLPNNVTTNGTGFTFTPRHTGSYVENLTVTDKDGGATTVHTGAINVTSVNPTATISGVPNGAINEGDTISLTANPSDAGADETFSYAWSVTNNNNFFTLLNGTPTNQANFSFATDDNGSYVVTCVVTDDSGVSVTKQTTAIVANNVAPNATISGVPGGDINEGDTVNLTANATDPGSADLDSLTYAWTVTKGGNPFTLPNNAVTNLSTFSFVAPDNDTYVATVVVTDKDGGTKTVHSGNIIADNVAPTGTITGAPASSPEGTSITLTAHGSDVGVLDTLSYSWAVTKDGNSFTLPNNVVTNAAGFTFVPTDNGSYVATVTITDKDGASTPVATSGITITNVAPTVAITGTPTTSPEGTQITFGSTVTDPGSLDTETYGWTVYKDNVHYILPNNTDITDNSFSFTPDDNGSYVVRLTVIDKDGGSTTFNSNAITVTNVAPTATVTGEPNGDINEGDEVDLTANVTDPGSVDTFTYAWSVLKDGESYNLGNIDTTDSTFSFNPDDNGSYVATVVVTDKDGGIGGSSSTAIIADNVAPSGTISGEPNGDINEGGTVQLSVAATDAGSADLSSLTYSWSVSKDNNPYTLPNNVVINATSFSFSPDDNGSYVATVAITDKDGGTKNVSSSTITVDNVAPTVAVTGMPTGNINEGDTVHLTATPTDPGTVDTFTYSWSVTKDGNSFTLPNNAVTNQANFTFVPTDQGTYVATCQVTDKDGGVGSSNSGNIIALNAPPVVTIGGTPNSAVNEGDTLNFTSSTSDPGANDTIATYAWSVTKDGNSFTLPNNDNTTGSTFSFVPTDNGTYIVSLSATDNDGGVGTKSTSSITVNNVAPTATISGQPNSDVNEGDTVSLTANVTDPGSVDTFTYAWSVKKDGSAYALPNNTVTNAASFAFVPRDNGAYVATVIVTDKDGGSDTVSTGTITADNVNPTASITGEPNGSINEGDSVTLTAHQTDPGADDTFTYSWSVKKDNVTFTLPNNTVTNASTFTFTTTDNGDYVATLVVTDKDGGQGSANSQTITALNVAPGGTITGAPASSPEGTALTLTAHGTDAGAADVAGLTYAWAVTKDNNPFTLPNNTVTNAAGFTFTPTDNGSYVATVTITDKDGASTPVATSAMTITNVAPSVTITGTPTTSPEGTQITFGSTVTDPGSLDTETYGWTVYKDNVHFTLPNNTNISGTTFSFTPPDNGSYVVRLTVIDKDGGSTTVNSDAITVTNVAPSGTISGEPNSDINEGDTVNLSVAVTDPGSLDTFTYAWSVKKDGVSYTLPNNTVTNTSSFTFIPRHAGNYVATVVVTDKDGGTTTDNSQTITADNVNPTATITGEPGSSINEGDTVSLTAHPSDAGADDTFTYAWSVKKDGNAYTLPNGTVTNAAGFTFSPNDNGAYVATVIVTDDSGGSVSVDSQTITALNVAPGGTITGAPASSPEGTAITLTAHGTDAGAADVAGLTYAWAVTKDNNSFTLPNNTVTNAAGFTFTPTDNGSYVATVTITDKDGASTLISTSAMTITNVAPSATITGAPGSAVAEGSTISLGSTVTDPGSLDTFTYAWSVKKDGQSYSAPGNPASNTSSYSFIADDNGAYVVSLTVTDKDGGQGTKTSNISVYNVNPTISISGLPGGAINEGDQVSLTTNVTDPGTLDTFTYIWSVKKDGIAYTLPNNVVTNASSFTFNPNDNGSYVATVEVDDNDGGAGITHTTAITVNNVAPTATISGEPNGSINEGATVNLTATVTDPGSVDTFTYAWSVKKDGNTYTLPNNAVTNAANFTFSPNDNGSYVATVVVTDKDGGQGSANSQTITALNVAPGGTITGAPASSPEGTALTLTAHGTDAGAADVAGLTYAWAVTKDNNPFTLPNNTVTNAAGFTFTPTDNGSYVATVTITDKDGASTPVATSAMTITNVAPSVTITGTPTTSPEGTQITFGSTVTDPGSLDTETYGWTVYKDNVHFTLPNNTNISGTTFSFTPPDNGSYVVRLTVVDKDGGSTTVNSSAVAVTNVAPTPTINGLPNGAINEGDTVSLNATSTDPGSLDTVTYAWSVKKDTVSYPLGNNVVTNASTFSFVPNDNGSYVVTLTATDKDGGTNSTSSGPITVNNVAPTPTISGEPNGSINEGGTVNLAVAVTDPGSVDTFTYAWSIKRNTVTLPLGNVATNKSTFSFVAPDQGSYVATCVVTDKDGGQGTATSQTITAVNVAPTATISGLPVNNTSPEGTEIDLSTLASDPGVNDTISYNWHITKNGNDFADGAASSLHFTPDDDGTYVVNLTVSDGDGGSDVLTPQTIAVTGVAPTAHITGLPNAALEGGEIDLGSTVTDPSTADTNAGFTYSWTVKNQGNTYASGKNANFSFTPNDNGQYAVTFTATDKDGLVGTDNETITVSNVKPVANFTGVPDGSVPEGTPITLGTHVTDAGALDTQAGFTYAWSVLKDTQTFGLPNNVATNQASFTFTPTDNGQYQVKCTVTDKDGGSVNISQNITVTNVAPSNAIISGAPTTSLEGTAISLSGSATDPGSADTFTYAWTVTKDNAGFTTGTGQTFNFTPVDNGSYNVSLVVTDDDGGVAPTVSKTITVTNVAPSGTFAVGSTGVVGTTTNATVTVSDPGANDTETVTIDWGDGTTPDTLSSGASATLSPTHVYQASGNFPVVTTVTDKDGGSSTVNSTVTVKSFAVQTDPMDNTKTALIVGGTNGDDTISFTQNSNGRIKAVMDGVLLGTFAPTGHIIAYGGGGNNTITVDPSITTSAILYGGSGKDVLQGGSGDDVLIGRRGNDALFGGAGRDILIGGVGADSMDGGTGEDILMGGSTAGSESFNFLAAITAEWSRTDVVFANRVKQLKGTLAGGLNGNNKLNDGDVFEDANPDTMTGQADSADWFLTNTNAGSGEVITDLGKTDVVTNVVVGISTKPPVKVKKH